VGRQKKKLTFIQITGSLPYNHYQSAYYLSKFVAPPYNSREIIPDQVYEPLRLIIDQSWESEVRERERRERRGERRGRVRGGTRGT
jgi:hypothetical protein